MRTRTDVAMRVCTQRGRLLQMSTAGPGWLANVARGRPRRRDALVMNRHLHYQLFVACQVCVRERV
jgi:hypothetical protein